MGRAKGRKTIFITGSASGIGAETARLFSRRNWFCGLYDVDEARLEDVAKELGEENCQHARLDVRSREEWQQAVNSFTGETNGHMHVLFNNAGVGRHGWFEDVSADDNEWIVDVNVKGVVNGIYAALPALKATPGSRIINTASTAGMVGSPQLAVYSATKFAVRGLTEALDVEFAPLGIRVTSLMPWFIDTPILDMGASADANVRMSDQLRASGARIYPVSLAAERAWDAAHGKATHYMVGKDAERARFLQRFLPGALRSQLVKRLPERT